LSTSVSLKSSFFVAFVEFYRIYPLKLWDILGFAQAYFPFFSVINGHFSPIFTDLAVNSI